MRIDPPAGQAPANQWYTVMGFALIVLLGLLVLPRETIQWFLVAVAVAMIYNRFN